jgi:enamine deaminase RidA (YjgF/YER057c/UK114 family)
MSERQFISSGSPWESIVGYSRAVRVGDRVFVAGTTASDETGAVIGAGDMAAQTRYIFRKIERALHQAGATLSDVVRTRMYITDYRLWEDAGRVHGEFFSEIRPAATMVQVVALQDVQMLIEIEVEAVITNEASL